MRTVPSQVQSRDLEGRWSTGFEASVRHLSRGQAALSGFHDGVSRVVKPFLQSLLGGKDLFLQSRIERAPRNTVAYHPEGLQRPFQVESYDHFVSRFDG
jgi:hypothetical protein